MISHEEWVEQVLTGLACCSFGSVVLIALALGAGGYWWSIRNKE